MAQPNILASLNLNGIEPNAKTAIALLRWLVNSILIPAIIIVVLAKGGRFGTTATASWMFGVFVGAGALGLILSLVVRGSVSASISLPGLALLLPLMSQFKLPDLIGAYLICGGAVIILTLIGQLEKVSRFVPSEVVMAMLAGVLLRQEATVFPLLVRDPWVIGSAVAAYFAAKRLTRGQLQSLVLAVIVGVAVAMVLDTPKTFKVPFVLTNPKLLEYRFSIQAALSISLPLMLAILGILSPTRGGWRTPNRISGIATGAANLVLAPFAGYGLRVSNVSPNQGNLVKTILAGAGLIAAGCLGLTLVTVLRQLPFNLLQVLTLLALLPLCLQALYLAIAKATCRLGALTAIMVAASNTQWYDISALFWAVVLGAVVAWLADRA